MLKPSPQTIAKIKKTVKDGFGIILLIGVSFLTITGAGTVFEDWKYKKSMKLVGEADDGTRFYVSEPSISTGQNGHIRATILIRPEMHTALHLQKMLEARRRGKDHRTVYGIERDIEVDFGKQSCRYTGKRLVGNDGGTIVESAPGNGYWMKIKEIPDLFKSVIDELRKHS